MEENSLNIGTSPPVKIIAIGDPHFKEKYLAISETFVKITIEQVKQHNPDFVVVLGDLLDTMNIVRTQSHKLAVKFLKDLGEICPTFFVIGNHDLMNHTQFLTDNHIFTPFHGVEAITNVYVIDKPKVYWHNDFMFSFCPYVPPGRFIEALNTLENEGELWEMSDCIFAHQEFKGAQMGAKISDCGDDWLDTYPPVISGHIHDSQILGNIYYTGSAIQHSFSETTKKGVWLITFHKNDNTSRFTYNVLNNNIRVKNTITLSVDEALNFNHNTDDNTVELRIKVVDNPSKLEAFSKMPEKQALEKAGIKILQLPTTPTTKSLLEGGKGNFWDNFHNIISNREDIKILVSKYI